ncbi:MAG: hypothetical protein M3Z22_04420 [Verrucomicrobiota bacterium]|nr:hypothetical protein [Verrucomicrobiota bacterium]
MKENTRLVSRGFSLVEVVLALGVVAFAIVAILGMVPAGLSTSHSAQDDTRAAQIAQDIFASLASQAQATYPNAVISQSTPSFSYPVNLASGGPYVVGANSDGQLAAYSADLPYKITMAVDGNPPGFDVAYASQVTVRVEAKSHDFRDFTRIVSKY